MTKLAQQLLEEDEKFRLTILTLEEAQEIKLFIRLLRHEGMQVEPGRTHIAPPSQINIAYVHLHVTTSTHEQELAYGRLLRRFDFQSGVLGGYHSRKAWDKDGNPARILVTHDYIDFYTNEI